MNIRCQDEIRQIAGAFDLGSIERITELGGTATEKFAIETARGRFVIRVRPWEFASEGRIQFDHETLRRLAAAGLPVPCLQTRQNGSTWLEHGGRIVEVLSWVEGGEFQQSDTRSIFNAGGFLAEFHRAIGDPTPVGKEGFIREDHPDLLRRYVDDAQGLAEKENQKSRLREVNRQLDQVKKTLDSGWYATLPAAVIHGDFHPGNVRFRDSRISAVFDFDYMSLQARARDVGDGLMFFASRRIKGMNPDEIVSLTQAFKIDFEWAKEFLRGYQKKIALTHEEWRALPWLIRSRWLQIRLRGSRKVPTEQKVDYILNRCFEVTDWLDQEADSFFSDLKHSLSQESHG